MSALAASLAAVIALAGCTSAPAGAPSDGSTGAVTCAYPASGTAAKAASAPPTATVSNSGTLDYVLTINGRPVGVQLNRASAPCTVNSFVSLAAQGYYDATTCHRLGVVTGFQMLQCGDPTGTGTGGPGYRFADELHGNESYPAGTLAMANAGADTNGSQFFLVFGDTPLSSDYTVFGAIDAEGVKALQTIAKAGTDNSEADGVGKPIDPVVITSVKPR